MTEYEREGRGAVSILRERLGVRYQAGLDEGRAEIVRVLAGELNISNGEADDMTRQLIDSGEIRYVTAAERDVDYSVPPTDETQSNVRHDQRREGNADAGAPGLVMPELNEREGGHPNGDRSDTGVPSGAPAGIHPGFAAPVMANNPSGNTAGAVPLAAGVPLAADIGDNNMGAGYWDFGSGAAGVRPSTTRKGQVEPLGT